jgi:hypothetical protein
VRWAEDQVIKDRVSLNLFLGPQVQMWSGSLGRSQGYLGSLPLSPALSVALSPDGDQVAVGYRADGIRIYKISSGTKVGADGKRAPLLHSLSRCCTLLYCPIF